ncbi:MAG: hypothetical protein U1E38_10425 [Rhodospirillales bacterium]
MISAGSLAGIDKGQIVLDGRAWSAASSACPPAPRVLLPDINSRVPVFVGKARIRAVLAGDNLPSGRSWSTSCRERPSRRGTTW